MANLDCPELCPILGTPIAFIADVGRRASENTASFDRVIPEEGYVGGNVQIISLKANQMKSDATPVELRRFAKWIIATYGSGE